MDRREVLTRGITKDMIGVEVGPWFAPLVPKAEGYKSMALDVFDQGDLLERARNDKSISEVAHRRIEMVDLVGGATEIAALVGKKGLLGQLDYIVSSHNFEHLPDPVSFLQGCQKALKPGGIVSMAIPDRRGSFDYFRPVSTTGTFLEAFQAKRNRPTASSLFELNSMSARRAVNGVIATSWDCEVDGGTIYYEGDVKHEFEMFKSRTVGSSSEYIDNHCFVFTRSSFELVIHDLHFVGLIGLGVDRMEGPSGCEFYARLINGMPVPSKSSYDQRRGKLVHDVIDESASNCRKFAALERTISEQAATIKALETSIGLLRATPSWRLTAPLRQLHSFFGK